MKKQTIRSFICPWHPLGTGADKNTMSKAAEQVNKVKAVSLQE
jgi:hypothetical protein